MEPSESGILNFNRTQKIKKGERQMKKTMIALALACAMAAAAQGQVAYNTAGSIYTQNFDTLADTGVIKTGAKIRRPV